MSKVKTVKFLDDGMCSYTTVRLNYAIGNMSTKRLKQYIRSVKTDRYRCEALEGECEQLQQMDLWLDYAYCELNGRKDNH